MRRTVPDRVSKPASTTTSTAPHRTTSTDGRSAPRTTVRCWVPALRSTVTAETRSAGTAPSSTVSGRRPAAVAGSISTAASSGVNASDGVGTTPRSSGSAVASSRTRCSAGPAGSTKVVAGSAGVSTADRMPSALRRSTVTASTPDQSASSIAATGTDRGASSSTRSTSRTTSAGSSPSGRSSEPCGATSRTVTPSSVRSYLADCSSRWSRSRRTNAAFTSPPPATASPSRRPPASDTTDDGAVAGRKNSVWTVSRSVASASSRRAASSAGSLPV